MFYAEFRDAGLPFRDFSDCDRWKEEGGKFVSPTGRMTFGEEDYHKLCVASELHFEKFAGWDDWKQVDTPNGPRMAAPSGKRFLTVETYNRMKGASESNAKTKAGKAKKVEPAKPATKAPEPEKKAAPAAKKETKKGETKKEEAKKGGSNLEDFGIEMSGGDFQVKDVAKAKAFLKRLQDQINTVEKPDPQEIESKVYEATDDLIRDKYQIGRTVPINELRDEIQKRLGDKAASHEFLDGVLRKMQREKAVRLIEMSVGIGIDPEVKAKYLPGAGDVIYMGLEYDDPSKRPKPAPAKVEAKPTKTPEPKPTPAKGATKSPSRTPAPKPAKTSQVSSSKVEPKEAVKFKKQASTLVDQVGAYFERTGKPIQFDKLWEAAKQANPEMTIAEFQSNIQKLSPSVLKLIPENRPEGDILEDAELGFYAKINDPKDTAYQRFIFAVEPANPNDPKSKSKPLPDTSFKKLDQSKLESSIMKKVRDTWNAGGAGSNSLDEMWNHLKKDFPDLSPYQFKETIRGLFPDKIRLSGWGQSVQTHPFENPEILFSISGKPMYYIKPTNSFV